MKNVLIGLLILIIALPFLFSAFYSVVMICEATGCGKCAIVGHHMDKWLGLFTEILTPQKQGLLFSILLLAVLAIVFFKKIQQEYFTRFKFYNKYQLSDSTNLTLLDSIRLNYFKRALSSQVYH